MKNKSYIPIILFSIFVLTVVIFTSCIYNIKINDGHPFKTKINADSVDYIEIMKHDPNSINYNDSTNSHDITNLAFNKFIIQDRDSINKIINNINNSKNRFIKWGSYDKFNIYNSDSNVVLKGCYRDYLFKIDGAVYEMNNKFLE